MFSPSVLPVTVRHERSSLSFSSQHQRAQAAGIEEILHQVFARRPDIGEHRHLARDLVEALHVERDAGAARHRDHVDDGVGRAAHRHVHLDGVVERGRRENAVEA